MNFWKCTGEKLLLLTDSVRFQVTFVNYFNFSTTAIYKKLLHKKEEKTLLNFFPIIIKTHHNATFKFIQHFNICGYRRRAPVSKSSHLWWVIIKKCFLPINYYKYYKYCESFLFAICTSILNKFTDSIFYNLKTFFCIYFIENLFRVIHNHHLTGY